MRKGKLMEAGQALDYYEQLVSGLQASGGMDVVSLVAAYERIKAALSSIESSELESAIDNTRAVIEALLQCEADLKLLKIAKEKLGNTS